MQKFIYFLIAMMILIVSCKKDDSDPVEQSCEHDKLPIVFIHGFLASGDTYANHIMRFSSNQYCEDRMFVFNWNTIAQNIDNVALLDEFIDQVLEQTNSSTVNLAGHSAGGGLSYNYLSNADRAKKVAKYVHIGSHAQSGPAGSNEEVPTLNIWSPDDKIVSSADIPGAENVQLPGQDHYEVATSKASFEAIYKFFNDGQAPEVTEITAESNIEISGRVSSFGENTAIDNASIFVYAVHQTNGERINEEPDFSIKSAEDGLWGPISVTPGQTYEFEVVTGISDDKTVYYYREGFKRSNPLVYLRTLPPPGSVLNLVLGELPEDDNQSIVIIFSSSQGILTGRDVLKVNEFELSTPEFAGEDNNTIALFLYDGNDNQQTDLTSQGPFSNFPFLEGIDMYFQTETPESIDCSFNGRSLSVRNKKSASDGIIIAVFD